jgi:cell division transport system permease protein
MRANFVMSGVSTGMRRNLGMTIALILNTAILLAFVGAAILANIEISKFRTDYESKINVSVYLCGTNPQTPCTHKTTQDETDALLAQMRSDPLIKSASYVSEQQQYDRGLEVLPPAETKLLAVGDLPASITVKLKNLKTDYEAFDTKYSKAAGVWQVQNQDASLKRLLDVLDAARWLLILIAGVVLVASVLVMGNTIRVAAEHRRNETSIMRLVGASRWMTELPFVLEVMIATFVGGLIAIGFNWLGTHFVLNGIFKAQVNNGVIPGLGSNQLFLAGGAALIAGLILAAITAFTTLRAYVRL